MKKIEYKVQKIDGFKLYIIIGKNIVTGKSYVVANHITKEEAIKKIRKIERGY